MGMDLVALRNSTLRSDDESINSEDDPLGMSSIPDSDDGPAGFHANWTWWGVLLGCLDSLGADLSSASGSNDGDEVSAETATAWADLLEPALNSLVLVQVKHTEPNSKFDHTTVHLLPSDGFRLLEYARVDGAQISFLNDLPSTEEYLKEFAHFLRTCGGFAQF